MLSTFSGMRGRILRGNNGQRGKILWGVESPFIVETSVSSHCLALLHRDVIFDGYTDALTIKLMNKGLSARNLTIRCSTQDVVEWNMYCQPLYEGDCTDVGFQVRNYGSTRELSRAYLVHRGQGQGLCM